MSQNRYEVLGKIADGGLGSVYKAYDRNLRREVALKRVRAESPEQAEKQAEQLMDEARNMSALQHPHIVTVYDVGRDEEGAYIIMELLKGETLEDIIERGALAEGDFRELVAQSLEGLIAAHSNGMIHLDIKPQNFMVIWLPSGKFQIKILDFGLAKIASQPTVQEMDDDGAIMGSIFFMAPEQFERSPVDARTDLYSLGCVYYFALAQQYPFQGETGPEVMASHMYHSFIPLSQLRPDLPPFISRWVEWLISRLPDHRPASAAQAYEIFLANEFPGHEDEHIAQAIAVTEGGLVVEEGAATSPMAPPGPRRTRPVAHGPQPGAGSGPLGARPAPKPIARPVNIAAAMAPKHLTLRKPWPKWAVFGIPSAIIAIIALIIAIQAIGTSRRNSRFQELAQGKAKATAVDVPMLLDFLEQKTVSEQAGRILEKIEGGDSLLTAHLAKAKEPWAKKNLASVIGHRGIGSIDALLRMLDRSKGQPEARKGIWEALARVGSATDSGAFISRLSGAPPDELRDIEAAIVSTARTDPNLASRGMDVLNAYRANVGGDEERTALLRALCRIGNKNALPDIVKALQDPKNDKLRDSAALALDEWPNAEPIGALVDALGTEKDPFIRRKAVNSLGALAGYAGDTPQGAIAASLIALHAKTKDAREQNEILQALARVSDPAAVKFFQDLSAANPKFQRQCNDAIKSINDSLAKAVTLANGANTLSPAQAVLSPGPLTVTDGIIINWFGTNDDVAWLVKIEKPSTFEVELSLSSAATEPGHYVVTFGKESWSRPVASTGSPAVFKTTTIGRATFEKPGYYRLLIKPVDIPKNSQLMRLKGATVIGAAN